MTWLAENDNPALRKFLSHVRSSVRATKRHEAHSPSA
jgi:hypothetical protein